MGRSVAMLLPMVGVVFIAFLIVGAAMPVLPLHVHQGLGFGTFMVGLVTASQFAASVLSRMWAGRHADMRGAKHAIMTGLVICAAAGLLYLLSLELRPPAISVTVLLLGRGLLGAGESFVITGAQAWGLALGGAENTGKVIAWMGTAMYAAFAVGAPAGTALYDAYGFGSIALLTTLVPLVALLVVMPLARVSPTARAHPSFRKVLSAVALPGFGLALASVGFGAITAFIALLFAARGWVVWTGFTAFAAAFIFARVAFGHLADRVGGARIALICVVIEAAGQALIWIAPWSGLALLGAALSGFGYSLVYPGFGVEAVRRVPAESRGLAMGAYTAFLDVALGIAAPLLGLIASFSGIGAVYLISSILVLGAAAIALRLQPSRHGTGRSLVRCAH
jgi:MFS family permease